jgi:hypothetical protein
MTADPQVLAATGALARTDASVPTAIKMGIVVIEAKE